jgi:hypothetical protein
MALWVRLTRLGIAQMSPYLLQQKLLKVRLLTLQEHLLLLLDYRLALAPLQHFV